VTSLPEEIPISDARDHFADVVAQATYAGRITAVSRPPSCRPG
jgi:hypothetical protein